MKSKIAKYLMLCIFFTLIMPLNTFAVNGLTFTMDDNYVNGNIYSTVKGVMAHEGSYVAWGQYGNIQTSTDGINWSTGSNNWTNASVAGNLYKIVYNDVENKYVGIGENCYASSSDGITWSSEPSSQNKNDNDLLFDNGKYYAVNSGYGGGIRLSPDGKNWSTLNTGLSSTTYYNLNGITYGNGKFIVVGSRGTVLSSKDGKNWSQETLNLSDSNYTSLNDVIYAGGQYIAVGNYGTIVTSSDGDTWVKRDTGLSKYWNNLHAISYGNGKYIVVGSGYILSSTDGVTWNVTENDHGYNQVCFDSKNGFVAAGSGSIVHSTNGEKWTEKNKQTISYIADLKFLNNQYVAVGKGFMTSADGITWKPENTSEDLTRITYGNGKYVGFGSNSNNTIVIKTSSDGSSWQSHTVNTADDYFWPRDITYGNSKFIIVNRGSILYSTDGVNWNQSNPGKVFKKVIFIKNQFIAGCDDGTILYSNDGVNWLNSSNDLNTEGFSPYFYDFAVGNNIIVGVGQLMGRHYPITSTGLILSSHDGITWTNRSSGTNNRLNAVCYGNGHFVAIGENGTVLSSADGTTWKTELPLTTGELGMIASNGSGFLVGMSANYNDRLFKSTSTGDWSNTLSINSSSLSPGTVDTSYNETLSAGGGTPPYTWDATGLPEGLSVDSSTGVISGTPKKAGTFTIGITVTDSTGKSANASLNLSITDGSTPNQSGDYEYTVTDGEATITKFTGSGGDITIPGTLGGYPVTSIGVEAFAGCTGLTTISIPESVTSIGEQAFDGCTSLTSINIPQGVTSIEDFTFNACEGLTAISIPQGVTSIGWAAFQGCTSLTSMNIPRGVTSIGIGAFAGCTGLTSINIPEGVTRIEDDTFDDCTGLTTISIPKSVTSIGEQAFYGCTSLTSINIPEGVARIENSTFDACESLTAITIPQGVTSIGEQAFNDCMSLKSISIPQGVTSIGRIAFNYCTSLTSIIFNSATTTIFDSDDTIFYDTKIIGHDPSTAKDYATKYDREFEVIGSTTDGTVTGVLLKTISSTEIDLSWDKLNGAKSYNIYRAASESGTYTKVGNSKSTSFKNTKLKPSTSYWYKVAAVTSSGESGFSDIQTATTLPLTPSGVKVKTVSSTEVTLSWKAIAGCTFNIYRSTSQKGDYTKIAEGLHALVYTDINLTPKTTYWYKVTAMDTNGNESLTCAPVKALTKAR